MSALPREAMASANGVVIVRTANNCFGVTVPEQRTPRVLLVEVDHQGRWYKRDFFNALCPYRDALAVDIIECVIRVREGGHGGQVLCELGEQPQGHLYQPWMVRQGDQAYITENYVSVPPALHLTDSVGARWTLGFVTAPKEQSPGGEFAFEILRDGVGMGEIASRLEIRNGVVRIFTRHGWKKFNGRSFI